MKILSVLILLLLTAGCTPDSMGKAKQDFACKDKGGVYKYVRELSKAKCQDGTLVDGWYDLTLTPEYYPERSEN